MTVFNRDFFFIIIVVVSRTCSDIGTVENNVKRFLYIEFDLYYLIFTIIGKNIFRKFISNLINFIKRMIFDQTSVVMKSG